MRKIILLLLLLAACTTQQTKDLSTYTCPDCNVILISIDTFRGDHLTCAGYDKYDVDITKNICDLASQGVFFTNAISQAPSTAPSHASILTSAIASHHQTFFSRNQSISKDYITLAEVLKNEDYITAGFTGSSQVSAKYGFDRGFDVYGETINDTFQNITEQSLTWLKNTTGKFFLFMHTYEIHHPYTPQEKYVEELKQNYSGTLGINISRKFIFELKNHTRNITPEDLQHIIAMYDAEILSVDNALHDFIEKLKAMNLSKKTIIILTSDHGEEFGEHGNVGIHAHALYNELLHVPLIVVAPGLKPAVNDKLVMSIDIAPTLLNILNISIPKTYEGKSLAEGEEYAISELDSPEPMPFAIQTLEMKYYWSKYFSILFNLTQDPTEQKKISNSAIAEALSAKYSEWVNKTKSTSDKVNVSKELREQLEALGYTT